MNIKELQEMKNKVKGGNKGLLPDYLSALCTESLDKLLICDASQLQYYQSRHKALTEIKDLLN